MESLLSIEDLPVEVTGKDGTIYSLRVKARKPGKGKKWCIRYIRKVTKTDRKIEHWHYRTEIQVYSMKLDRCANRMHQALKLWGYK